MAKGKLIVIEGTDGSGKSTQVDLLVKRLTALNTKTELIKFPKYESPSAYFVQKYLHGQYGLADEVGPYAGSLFFTLDRYDHAKSMKASLEEGVVIICDRFTSANMGHQAGKISNLAERDTYLEWLNKLEFETMGIPKPDAVIFLFVDVDTSQRLMAHRTDKAYLEGKKKDIHEADIEHLRHASEAFLYVAKKYGWIVIDCAPKTENNLEGALLSIDEIHQKIWKEVERLLA